MVAYENHLTVGNHLALPLATRGYAAFLRSVGAQALHGGLAKNSRSVSTSNIQALPLPPSFRGQQ